MESSAQNSPAGLGRLPGGVTNPSPTVLLWRNKWVLIATFLTFTVVTAVVSTSVLEKEYEATVTLLVTQPKSQGGFDQVQAGESLAQTYSEVVSSDNVAALVSDRLGGGESTGEIQARIGIDPVPETQLLTITATGASAREAEGLANTYAGTVVSYALSNLDQPNRSTISVADRAPLPEQPARPRPTLYTLLGGLIGLVLGSALAILAGLVDRRVRSADELSELLGVPILGSVAMARSRRTRKLNDEAYRVLRTNLEFVRPGKPLRSVAVVSPSEGDGKSSAVLNLARAISEVGDRVIVIEGDMRRPSLQAALCQEMTTPLRPGLSNFLTGAAELREVVYPTDLPEVRLVPAGPMPPAASALLDTERGQGLLTSLSELCDVVVVDTPPLSVGADASLLCAGADETMMVVDLKRSNKKSIRFAAQQLRLVKASLSGVILNRVRENEDTGAYAYGYGDPDARKRRLPKLRARKQTAQSEDVPAPEVLPSEPYVADERTDLDENGGHDDVGAGRIFADAGHEQSGHGRDDR